jgi:hypothetical protein
MNSTNMLVYPLNGFEMQFLNPNTKLITYDKLNNINTVRELFGNHNAVIILYLLKSKSEGHWVCLFKNHIGINFFDSYGHAPDYQIDNLTPKQRKEYNEKAQRLHEILRFENVKYNNRKIQSKGTMTCGCFVSHRLHHSYMDNSEYRRHFFNGKIPDKVVANYCLKRLKYI